MSKVYDKLWVFGDSYTTPDICVDPRDSFWGLTASYCNIPKILNCSRPVNSFDSVCHLLVSEQTQYNWDRDLLLIGIPPLARITVFDDFKDTPYYGHEIKTSSWESDKFQIHSHHGLVGLQNYGTDKQMIIHDDRGWLETQVLRTIFFLTSWLDSNNANYMIINLSKEFDWNNIWGPSNFVLPYALQHSRCILFDKTYCNVNLNKNPPPDFDQYGWDGHPGPVGNRCFFEQSLLPQMQKCNLI